MKTQRNPSRLIGPEDVRPGDYVTIAHTTFELIPCLGDEAWRREVEPARVTIMPCCAGRPLRVASVCVPFVLVQGPSGQHDTLDLRCQRLARLSEDYGRKAFKRFQADRKRSAGRKKR